eukprot:TRINITY_DN65227_c0_g1_i1.p1 TRINITY_DN65227_c0_g1~~TRINITY_DN65227_c0_g1_i1.p1  ORF type:complete len:660 (+),score=164.69 TRINITY_DN65227_c0_g1_i1:92-1981(+)
MPGTALPDTTIDDLFGILDVRNRGHISAADLRKGARAFGTQLSEQGAELLVREHGTDGAISQEQFRDFVRRREQQLRELFAHVARLGVGPEAAGVPGKLGKGMLLTALQEMGIPADEQEVDAFVRRIDRDGDGSVCYTEFRAWMLLQPVISPRACLSRNLGDSSEDQLFRDVDLTGDGYIDADELVTAARLANVPLSLPQAQKLLGGKQMAREEFTAFVKSRERELRKVFSEMVMLGASKADPENLPSDEFPLGRLGPRSLRTALRALGIKASDRELQAFIRHLDADNDGVISFEEFRKFSTFLPAANAAACFEQITRYGLEAADGQHTPAPETDEALIGDISLAQRLAEKLLAGGAAGVCSRTATAPIDRVKTIMQARQGPPLGLVAGLREIHQEGGFRAFFRGNGANCVKVTPETAVRFVVFDLLKSLSADPAAPSVAERFAAGGAAGACAQAVVYPLEIAKTRLALSQPGIYQGIGDCVRSVAVKEGASALFAGLGPSVAGIIPYAAIDLGVNSMLKDSATRYYQQQGREPGLAVLLGTGMVSSTCGMLCTYPLNLVRTRLQAQGLPGAPKYDSAWHVVRDAVQRGGYAGLYRGILPNMLKVLPATSISYTVYGMAGDLMNRQHNS